MAARDIRKRWRAKLRAAVATAARAKRVIARHPDPKPAPPKRVTMYDSVTPSEIPTSAPAVAGYVGGRWPTYPELVRRFPSAKKLSVAVNASQDAQCLDVEPGDATPQQAAAWVRRQQARGVKRPVIYASVSQAATVLRCLGAAGIKRSDIRLWTAHYTGIPHVCSPKCGFGMPTNADATQYYDKALSRNLDVSLCEPWFFGPGLFSI